METTTMLTIVRLPDFADLPSFELYNSDEQKIFSVEDWLLADYCSYVSEGGTLIYKNYVQTQGALRHQIMLIDLFITRTVIPSKHNRALTLLSNTIRQYYSTPNR